MAKEINTVERDGFRLSYHSEGASLPAIIIGSSVYYPRIFSSDLCKKIQLVYLDHHGFGKEMKPFNNSSFELDVLIDDIEATRKKLELEKIAVIGHSGHAFMAFEKSGHTPQLEEPKLFDNELLP